MTEIFDILIEQRSVGLMLQLFGPKPFLLPTEDWNRIRELTRVAEVNLGSASYGLLRTEEEQEALRLTAVRMTEGEVDTCVGEYWEEKGRWTLTIERDGRELKLIFSDGYHTNAVPTGNHSFVELTYWATMEFIVENGKVTQLTREIGKQSPPQRWSKQR